MPFRVRNSVHATPISATTDNEDEKPLRFFSTRRLSTLFRRASATSPPGASATPSPSAAVGRMSAPSSSLGAAISSFMTSTSSPQPQATSSVTAIDQQMVFFGAKKYALATTSGVRNTNEDRFRVITSLERFGKGLLATEKKRVRSYDDALTQKLMESYVNNANAPAFDALKKNKTSRGSKSGGETEFYGIYDGHGGARCSSLLALLLPLYLLRQREFESDIASAAKRACLEINDEILKREAVNQCEGGSTAITLLVRKGIAYFCNTGDCRAIIVSRKGVTALTTDHKATNEQEKQRIEEAGGIVLYVHGVPRVNGRLAVSRAFGDSELKEVVIPTPDITTHELTADDDFIVLASDGLWDAIPNEMVLSCIRFVTLLEEFEALSEANSVISGAWCLGFFFIRTHPWLDVHEMAKLLVDRAIELGSMDNVTVLIVDVRKRP